MGERRGSNPRQPESQLWLRTIKINELRNIFVNDQVLFDIDPIDIYENVSMIFMRLCEKFNNAIYSSYIQN